jgi:hypothetical protein
VIGGEPDTKPVKKTFRADDGLEIVGEVRGRGDAALIFLHGWCGDREYWKHQIRAFAADYRVVAIDQAGHGESGKDRKAWTADGLAGDVEAVVKAGERHLRVLTFGLGLEPLLQLGVRLLREQPGERHTDRSLKILLDAVEDLLALLLGQFELGVLQRAGPEARDSRRPLDGWLGRAAGRQATSCATSSTSTR